MDVGLVRRFISKHHEAAARKRFAAFSHHSLHYYVHIAFHITIHDNHSQALPNPNNTNKATFIMTMIPQITIARKDVTG